MKRTTKDGPFGWFNHETLLGVAALGGERVAVYIALCHFESRDIEKKESFSASREQLAKVAGVGVRTVTRCLSDLIKGGFVAVRSGRNLHEIHSRNRYTLQSASRATEAHLNGPEWPINMGQSGPTNGPERPDPCGPERPTIKKERNIEPGPSRPRDSIEEEKKASHENMSGLRPANSQPEENVVPVDFNPIPACFRNKALMERL
jgi:hypothetical protein